MNKKREQESATLIYKLNASSRAETLRRFAPRFSQAIAEHITYESNLTSDAPLPPKPQLVRVVGYAADEAIEALVAEVDGTTKRRDGGTYHITLSLEPEQRKAQDSNQLLVSGWESCDPFTIEVIAAKNE